VGLIVVASRCCGWGIRSWIGISVLLQQDGSHVDSYSVDVEHGGSGGVDEGTDQLVDLFDLGLQELDPLGQTLKCHLGGVGDRITVVTRTQPSGLIDQLDLGEPEEPIPEFLRGSEY